MSWRNWGATAFCTPRVVVAPESEDQLAATVAGASSRGERVKVAGTGHSFTDIACTDGTLLTLDRMNRVLGVDREASMVTAEAGIRIERLGEELAAAGLALPNLGDIGYQTIAGAISTATHGTGSSKLNISSQVVALTLVMPDGSLRRCSETQDPELLRAARVGLGALGVISNVTLRCVPAFNLRFRERPARLDEVLDGFDELAAGNDHFEFYWLPHTDAALTIANNRTDEPARGRGRARAYLDDVLMENHAFGLVQRLGRLRPGWIPSLARFTGRLLSSAEGVDRSDLVFTNPRLVRFAEMEYAIPRQRAVEAVRALRSMVDRSGLQISFPVEVRVLAGDEIPLSTAFGRDTAYIAVHVYWKSEWRPYFREVASIMDGFGGRPHWGKLHFHGAETLRRLYPQWQEFLKVRDRVDPGRTFGNAYLERVLGS